MADNLKKFFGKRIVESLAADLERAHPGFDRAGFAAASLQGLESLELIARAWHIAEAMRRYLPEDFRNAASVLARSLGPELQSETEGMEVFRYLPHVLYVSKYGLDFFEESMRLQYELTKRFTAEFSIRAYLVTHPEQTYARLRSWANDPSVHVRRLVSEGTRPRLPWAPRLRAYQEDPSLVLALLELLKDDSELYVRRSVANNLNDIAKDHPDVVVETCRRWLKESTAERKWIVKHALRSLVKAGHPAALKLLGVGAVARVRLKAIRFSGRSIRVGGKLTFSFDVVSHARGPQSLLVDYAVYFMKAGGKVSRKVFKLRRANLPPGARMTFAGSVSFRQMTTRKHHPGVHRLEALINGRAFPLGMVRLLP